MSVEPLEPMERWRLGQATRERPWNRTQRARTLSGLTTKQATILGILIAYGTGEDGLTSRDFEAQLARTAAETGVIGWAASDCTIALNRLESRGLVRREHIEGVRPGRGQARQWWFVTDMGEQAYCAWLARTNPKFAEDMAWLAKMETLRQIEPPKRRGRFAGKS